MRTAVALVLAAVIGPAVAVAPGGAVTRRLFGLGTASGVVASAPAFARSSTEFQLKSSSGETDLKAMRQSFEQKLSDDDEAKKRRAVEEAKPLNVKLKEKLTAPAEPTSGRPPQGKAVPRVKKEKKPRFIGDGLGVY